MIREILRIAADDKVCEKTDNHYLDSGHHENTHGAVHNPVRKGCTHNQDQHSNSHKDKDQGNADLERVELKHRSNNGEDDVFCVRDWTYL